MRFLLGIIYWGLYFPLLRLLSLLLFWNSKLEDRERFEKKNKFEYLAHSFKEWGEKADLCFEFSSEGEFQQVAPLIDDALKNGLKLELVFFSPSVEKTILKLAKDHATQIRYLRYPLVRLMPFIRRRCFSEWVTAKTLIMVRYDLFPEFLLWSLHPEHELRMVWMTFKKERIQGKKISLWKKLFLKSAKKIVYAVEADQKLGHALNLTGEVFDFRMEQIHRRMLLKNEKFKSQFPLYPDFQNQLNKYPKRVILGNAWPSDLFLLRDLPSDVLLVIVPHQLSQEILDLFREGLDLLGREVFELTSTSRSFEAAPTILVNQKGILCELYGDFSHAYVGGGFEGSIHSVLEPLVARAEFIGCGPFHHRSTEFDVVEKAGRMTELNTPEEFIEWLNKAPASTDHVKMDWQNHYPVLREFVIQC